MYIHKYEIDTWWKRHTEHHPTLCKLFHKTVTRPATKTTTSGSIRSHPLNLILKPPHGHGMCFLYRKSVRCKRRRLRTEMQSCQLPMWLDGHFMREVPSTSGFVHPIFRQTHNPIDGFDCTQPKMEVEKHLIHVIPCTVTIQFPFP